jgi:hypothetical protein
VEPEDDGALGQPRVRHRTAAARFPALPETVDLRNSSGF